MVKNKKTVLIVDDTAFMRILLKDIFEKHGYDVVGEAEDAISAAKMFGLLSPDLVTMDITMPEIDGIKAVKMIKNDYPNAIIIMISAQGLEDKVLEAITAGAKNFIVKPIVEEKLIEIVEKTLQ